MKKQTKILLVLSALVFPLGRQNEIDLETTSLRNFVSWFGARISPYFYGESDSSRWAVEKIGLQSKGQWVKITGGPIWFNWGAGTPPGNWMILSTMKRCYVQAPESEKDEVCTFTRQMLNASNAADGDLRMKLHNEAVARWLR